MPIINNDQLLQDVAVKFKFSDDLRKKPIIMDPFVKDFSYRFCWSSNALEGNTLSLDETVSLIDYDEVSAAHTYTEYTEAKNLYKAIQKQMIPFQEQDISAEWIKASNGLILAEEGEYRKGAVYVGNLAEAVYYPPHYTKVPELMENYLKNTNFRSNSIRDIFETVATQHIEFERIHPFHDGNGRTGRMILNQQLINNGLYPVTFNATGKYRQAFRIYNRNRDISSMVHILAKAELQSIDTVKMLQHKLEKGLDYEIENSEAIEL